MKPVLPLLVAVALAVALLGCTQQVPILAPAQFVKDSTPQAIWISWNDQRKVRMDSPSLHDDTLVGLVNGEETRVALADITAATVEQKNTDKFVKYSVVIGATAVAAVLLYKVTHQASFPAEH
ncbi:MAG TPA: hypothetical protein VLV45_09960 [Gemmatimonadales bacterium]|nr:hypothetical protein [Gemmatimonadales bacterium]